MVELRSVRLLISVVCLAALTSSAFAAGASGAGAASVDGATLTRALRGLVATPGGPPGAIAVVQHGRSRARYRAGVADLQTGRPIRASDHMRLASVSKAFSGAVALALVDRGRLSLDDTIGKLLRWLPRPWWPVTLRQALNHTSGLPNFAGRAWQEALAMGPHATPPPPWLLAYVSREPLVFKPGSRYAYSNSDNIVVGLMIEAATGRSFEQELAALVLRPLSLRQTSLPAGFRMPFPFLHGYDFSPPPRDDLSTVSSGAWTWAAGGMVSTPADLNRFIRGYAGRALFSRRVQSQQLRFVVGHSEPIGPGSNSAGLGIFRYRTRCGTVYGHTGNYFGYTQFAAATLSGRNSVTMSVSEQLNQDYTGQRLAVFKRLRAAEAIAVCAALGNGR
ncbi:MAG: serine hydrolase domain-containing protein [Solirubrobacteraceae bacterium]